MALSADFVPNGSDGNARYSYEQQPTAGKWALARLGEALRPLLSDDEVESCSTVAVEALFDAVFEEEYLRGMRRKLGLMTSLEGTSG